LWWASLKDNILHKKLRNFLELDKFKFTSGNIIHWIWYLNLYEFEKSFIEKEKKFKDKFLDNLLSKKKW
jgi:hypothetical protein